VIKKRDEFGLREGGRLMGNQKQAVIKLVDEHREQGRSISDVLGSVGVARSSYYRWKKSRGEKKERRQSSYQPDFLKPRDEDQK
jgi:ACT domain-containing protein